MKYFISILALMSSFNILSQETKQEYKERMRAADKKMAKNNHITHLELNKKKANENRMLKLVRSMNRLEKTNLSEENILKIANIMDSMIGMKFNERIRKQKEIDLIKKGEQN